MTSDSFSTCVIEFLPEFANGLVRQLRPEGDKSGLPLMDAVDADGFEQRAVRWRSEA